MAKTPAVDPVLYTTAAYKHLRWAVQIHTYLCWCHSQGQSVDLVVPMAGQMPRHLRPPPRMAAKMRLQWALDGWVPGTPDPETAQLDRDACRECICPACGHHGLRFEGFVRAGAYRGLAECPRCGAGEEV